MPEELFWVRAGSQAAEEMRFGKLLAAVTQKSRANEPYLSYKDLKHNISKVHAACGLQDDAEQSSGDEGPGLLAQERLESQAASSSSSHVAASSSANARVVGPQEDFFNLIHQDVTAAKLYVQSTVSGLEAMLGEFQVAAVKAGLLFTPQQLEEVSRQLPAPMDQEALVEWLLSLRPGAKTREERCCLVEKCAPASDGKPVHGRAVCVLLAASLPLSVATPQAQHQHSMLKTAEDCIGTSEEEEVDDDELPGGGPYATLAAEGPKESMGSVGHPDQCTPCTFYCFTRRGCNRGADCKFCHMTHQSKLQQRREAWKKQQREKRKLMRGFAHKERLEDAPPAVQETPQPRSGGKGKKLEGQAKPALGAGGISNVRSVVFTYTPSRVTLTMGQQTDIRPALFGPTATRRFASLGRLPEGLSLDPMTGTISGTPLNGSPWAALLHRRAGQEFTF
eukprot:s5392_g1.t5